MPQIYSNLDIFCVGGAAPPRNCAQGMSHDPTYTFCTCSPGLYESGSGCAACPAGHYCINGIKKQCDNHFYQDNQGATACKPCTQNGQADGFPLITCQYQDNTPTLLQWCDQSVEGSQSQPLSNNCRACSRCSALNVPKAQGQYDCYNS